MSSTADYRYRTAITRLEVSPPQETLLRDTVAAWKRGCQIAVDQAWKQCHTASAVQELAYDRIRDQTELGSQHSVLASHQAAENIRSCIEQRKNGEEPSKPTYTSPSITYDSRTMTIFREEGEVSLTVAGDSSRIRVSLCLPDSEDGYQFQYLDSDAWVAAESTLHYRDGGWFLHIGFRKPAPDSNPDTTENGTVLGVDLGVNQVAVTSTARFFSAGELNHKRREFEQIRGDLQRKGTRSARRTLRSVTGRETEYVKHTLHGVAAEIIQEAIRYGCDGIVFEELGGIRDRLREAAWHSTWAFDRLSRYVEYKARDRGLFVKTVDPENTSKRCAECGYTDSQNRRTRDSFECQKCGNRNHADYNAAKNIAAKYLRREQQSSRRRGVSQYALKSGTVTVGNEFTPYPDGQPITNTDKSALR